MWQKFSASLILCFFAVTNPLSAFAQQTQPSSVPQPPLIIIGMALGTICGAVVTVGTSGGCFQ